MDSVARGTVINLVTRLTGVALVLAITAIAARISTETQGAFAIFTSVEGVLLALLSGFGVALARRVSHHGERPRALTTAVVMACLALGVISGLALAAWAAVAPPAYRHLWLLGLAAPLLLQAPNLQGLWLGEGRMVPMARLAVSPPLLACVVLVASLAAQTPTLGGVLVAWVGAKMVVGLAVLIVLWRGGRLGRPDFSALRAESSFVIAIGVTNLVGLLNYRVGLFVVERQLGLSATGVYSIAVVVAELLWFVSGSLTQAVYGRIGTPDRARAAATTVRVVQLGLVVLVLAAPLLWLAAAAVLPRALGPAYAASLTPLALLLPGALVFGGASALSAYFTNHVGAPHVSAQAAFGSLVLNAGLAWWLVPVWGMAGAAVAASLAYVSSVAYVGGRFARHAGLRWRDVWLPGAQLARDLRSVVRRRGVT